MATSAAVRARAEIERRKRESTGEQRPLTFLEFIARVNPKYRFYRHLINLIAVLQKVADGEIARLMVFMPPRHGKSETISRLFTAYYLYRHPEKWVATCSYADSLASTLSRNARENYRMAGGLLNPAAEGMHHWETNRGGGMWAAGVGGQGTGKGFHLGLIDDPVKNAQEASSALIRERNKDWYRSTFGTREEPGAAIIVVQTRWNADDLSGWLLAQEESEDDLPEQWHVVCLPAIKEHKPSVAFSATCTVETDDRLPGEALCPERYDTTKLGKLKRRVGTYYWNALYQQAPSPDEGDIFKRHHWRYWRPKGVTLPSVLVRLVDGSVIEIETIELPTTFEQMLQSWDCAFKDAATSDFVAGQVWGKMGADKFLLDYYKERASIVTTMEWIVKFTEKWPRAIGKLVEDKANGPAVIQLLRNKIAGLIAVEPAGGKLGRAYAAQPEVEAGNVYLPHPALFPWVSAFVDSCASFPNGANDDDVDAFTQVLIRWQGKPGTAMPLVQGKASGWRA